MRLTWCTASDRSSLAAVTRRRLVQGLSASQCSNASYLLVPCRVTSTVYDWNKSPPRKSVSTLKRFYQTILSNDSIKRFYQTTFSRYQTTTTKVEDPVVSSERPGVFTVGAQRRPYRWKPPKVYGANPANSDLEFVHLLMEDVYIDKSASLHYLLKHYFNATTGDFFPTTLCVVYPRRFAKTTMLQCIEAIFSPTPKLKYYTMATIKTKIASLMYGPELLQFGMHPVLRLDMQSISKVAKLLVHIENRLLRAGLDEATARELKNVSVDPSDFLVTGVKVLNQKFEAKFGVATTTMVLIDEHDKPFRNNKVLTYYDDDDGLLPALIKLYGLGGKDHDDNDTGISLLMLCGLTRMVGSGLYSQLNTTLVDVSQQSEYHGLCGISAQEFVDSCGRELDKYTEKKYNGQTLDDVLKSTFIPRWNGFRFGLTKGVGLFDPCSPAAALFSPLDVWEIVKSLVEKQQHTPSSKWIATIDSEFEFTSFAERYTSTPDGFIELSQNLDGDWWDAAQLKSKMKREEYMLLSNDLHVQKVLLELGLLSVKEVGNHDEVLVGSPNWMVTQNAMRVLVNETHHGSTPQDLANFYLNDSEDGFGTLVDRAKKAVTKIFGGKGKSVIREFSFQDCLFMQLFYRFPVGASTVEYKLYEEAPVGKLTSPRDGRFDMGIALLYTNGPTKGFVIELKLAKIESNDASQIRTAHLNNIAEAKQQVQACQWIGETVDIVQKVAVSGVWHPSITKASAFELSATYEFLHDSTR